MKRDVHAGLAVLEHAAPSGLPAVLSALGVLNWIAFRGVRSRSDIADAINFTVRWGHSSAGQTLEALEARASPSPFCIWEPLSLDGELWDGHSFKHVAWSPNGPKMLRWILRQLQAKQGRIVSFREAAEVLRAEVEANLRDDELIKQAKRDLMEVLRARRLTAWGKPNGRRGQPNPAAEYEAIKASVYLDDLVSLTEWNAIGADPDNLTAIVEYRGPSYRDVRFYAADVLQVWPAGSAETITAVQTVSDERKLVQWLTELMRAKPKSPMSKGATKEAAATSGQHFSERAFSRAWAMAVQQSGAARWSSPGRKSKRRIDTRI